ncbi:MAG: two-component system response regulator [Verrucomicrobiales bacterium]|jgi:CheY-like chemotaxis protein|nr:two-component system response regulator [Verrucomicrobiales bacterium]
MKPILYAEDEKNDAFFMERAFEKVGISNPLIVVSDGQAVIDYLTGALKDADPAQPPTISLLLLDLNLPKKSGLEVLKWVRAQPVLRTLPVLMITASIEEADLQRAYSQGANAYLVKPAKPADLVAMVKSIKDFWLTQNRPAARGWVTAEPAGKRNPIL